VAKSLVVVESPTKARTVKKLLDRKFEVVASMGHVKDLPRSQLGVDVEHEFAPKYVVPKGKGPVIKELKAAAKKAAAVYLATDPDREGEAISWHLATILNPLNPKIKRIEFHEVTRDAIRRALAAPRDIDASLVNAQQARRILDRLVGYKISPLLWRKVRGGLSAGRVQSVAVRLICEREAEIEAFVPQEYWSIAARLARDVQASAGRDAEAAPFLARLVARNGEKVEIPNEAAARAIVSELERLAFVVSEIRRRDQQRHPAAPFTTSTLQQEANRKLGYSAARTMVVAQQLYEGLDVGPEGTVGLITYMRTDAVRVAEDAQRQARDYIAAAFGAPYVPSQPRQYTSRRGAQGAHEAIRPTSVLRTPDAVKAFLKADQYKIYRLIWERFVASQMASAVLDTLAVDIAAGVYLFRATGSRIKFPGFLRVYLEGRDNGEEETPEGWLPDVQPAERLRLLGLDPAQHFTQPPPRFTEATLVRALEERGIGRPSTYAPIIETIKQRGYVEVEDRRLYPTDLGDLVNSLLVEHFPNIVDVDFTAHLEEDLDKVEEGDADWIRLLREFYGPFADVLHKAEQNIEEVEITPEEIGEPCPRCGHPLVKRRGRYGEFIACSAYPACSYTRPVGIGVRCPLDQGEIVERRTRKGRVFYGCANYPACTYTSWDHPTGRMCPKCGQMLVTKRARRGAAPAVVCSNKACDYKELPRSREVEQVGAPS
jgi:DNA topoisomerase-1